MEISSRSFLVIDDDAFARTLAAEALKKLGATVISAAEDGQAALDHLAAAERPPDVLLVDLNMPGTGGAEFLRRAAKDNYQGRVIVVSGLEEEVLEIADIAAKIHGIDLLDHIKKPVSPEKLQGILAGTSG